MNVNSKLSLLCAVTLSTGMIATDVNAGDFDIEKTESLEMAVNELDTISINAGAGSLTIKGNPELAKIKVSADLKVNKDNYELSLKSEGDVAYLIADANPNNDSNWWGESPSIDLTVELPDHFKLKVKDGSGEIDIINLSNDLTIRDGSGSIEVSGIKGNLDINDGSGSITVNDIDGELIIDDGSGSITVTKVSGKVVIDDGSGSINVSNLASTLDIEDGSGSMSITSVKGHVTIDDGSGGISLVDLAQGVTVIEEGSGGLSMKDVRGKVNMK